VFSGDIFYDIDEQSTLFRIEKNKETT